MKKQIKIALSPTQEYVYPVMNNGEVRVFEKVVYGGDKSESVPCGFVSTLNYVPVTRKRRINAFKEGYRKEISYIKRRLAKTNLERVKAGSLAQDNRT